MSSQAITTEERLIQLEKDIDRARKMEEQHRVNHQRAELFLEHLLCQRDLLQEYQAYQGTRLKALQQEAGVAA